MFIHGLKYIVPGQNQYSRKSINDIVAEQYQNISRTVKGCLNDHRMSVTDDRAKQTFPALERLLYDMYSKALPRNLARRAQREYRIVRSIHRLIRQRPDIVVRRTDKSKVFYIGKADIFERKAQEYMIKTEAYEEIRDGSCPLAVNLHAVQTLLDYFVTRKALTKKQANKLLPNLNKLELGHYYGLPKPHKVSYFLFDHHVVYSSFLYLARDAIATDYCFDECTSNIDIEISQ